MQPLQAAFFYFTTAHKGFPHSPGLQVFVTELS